MHIEFDVTLQCNFSCQNCNRHSNFNDLSSPMTGGKENKVGMDLYDNTDVTIEKTKKFIEEVKQNGTVDKIHLIGGEPLTHPHMDKICDLVREELWGKHVKEILIVSNIHPKMIKQGTLDTPEEIIKYMFTGEMADKIMLPGYIYDFEHIGVPSTITLATLQQILNAGGVGKENILEHVDNIKFNHPELLKFEEVKKLMDHDGMLTLSDMLPFIYTFHGIPLVNYKPLSKKATGHRCSLVAPYDTGQEMEDTCNHPSRCGVNYAWDGYYPCANGAAISRLFKLGDKYKKDKLPKSITEWEGIVEGDEHMDDMGFKGQANTKHPGMWDLCKLCQVCAKNPLQEKVHGRPISVSYRKAMGLEGDGKNTPDYIVKGHKKKLAPVPERNRESNFETEEMDKK